MKAIFNTIRLIVTFVAVLVGAACLILAYFYYSTPVNLLPPIMTGYIADSGDIYYRHMAVALGAGIALFVFTWLINSIGRKKPMQAPDNVTGTETLKL